eukprot:15465962-Alexandrium_andersonii.AAC.1
MLQKDDVIAEASMVEDTQKTAKVQNADVFVQEDSRSLNASSSSASVLHDVLARSDAVSHPCLRVSEDALAQRHDY